MRRAYNAKFLFNTDNEFFGIDLGYDYCAEHEWGIRRLQQGFGCYMDDRDFGKMGIDRYKAERVPIQVCSFTCQRDKVQYYGLYVSSSPALRFNIVDYKHRIPYSPLEEVSTAWDDRDFIITTKKENKAKIDALEKAILNKDVVVFVNGSTNPFGRGGLRVLIYSKIPKELFELADKQSKEYKYLYDRVSRSGIEKYLAEHGKKYYALIPRINDNDELEFFLNPEEQDKYDSGWFSIQELKDWCKGKGPIVK